MHHISWMVNLANWILHSKSHKSNEIDLLDCPHLIDDQLLLFFR